MAKPFHPRLFLLALALPIVLTLGCGEKKPEATEPEPSVSESPTSKAPADPTQKVRLPPAPHIKIIRKAIQDLEKGDEQAKLKAARRLGTFRSTLPVPALIRTLEHRSEAVVLAASNTLFRIGRGAVDLLVEALRDEMNSPAIRFRSANVLANIGSPKAVPALIESLQDMSALALGKIRDPRGVDPLIAQLRDWMPSPREFAATALGEIGDKKAVEPLRMTLEDGYRTVREAAAGALKALTGEDHGGKVEGPDAADPLDSRFLDLEIRVFTLLVQGNVALAAYVDEVLLLADAYVDHGRIHAAAHLYEKGLSVNPGDIGTQLKLAHLSLKRGDRMGAAEKAWIVMKYAKTSARKIEANNLLVKTGIEPPPERDTPKAPAGKTRMVLVPVGDVDGSLLSFVRTELESRLGIATSLSSDPLPPGGFDRDGAYRFLAQQVNRIRSLLSKDQFQALVDRLQPDEKDLSADKGKIALIEGFLASLEDPEAQSRDFRRKLIALKRRGQFNAFRLLAELEKKHGGAERPPHTCFLGIASIDIFTPKTSFIFGLSKKGYALFSIYRLQIGQGGAPPDRRTLLDRLRKQAIASALSTLGLDRCTTPACAFAYAHGLAGLDRGSADLCLWCRDRLEKRIR
jgi:predicted Zn-dependent protease